MATAPYVIRTFGDPVLKQQCTRVEHVDDSLRKLVEDMTATMYAAPGVGLAAPQVGVQKRLFVYDDGAGGGPRTMINPVIEDASGEFTWEEGCLSVPGLYFDLVRPNSVQVKGADLDGHPLEFVAEGFLGRIMQHEVDHLNGLLVLDRLDDKRRKKAIGELNDRAMRAESSGPLSAFRFRK